LHLNYSIKTCFFFRLKPLAGL